MYSKKERKELHICVECENIGCSLYAQAHCNKTAAAAEGRGSFEIWLLSHHNNATD